MRERREAFHIKVYDQDGWVKAAMQPPAEHVFKEGEPYSLPLASVLQRAYEDSPDVQEAFLGLVHSIVRQVVKDAYGDDVAEDLNIDTLRVQ